MMPFSDSTWITGFIAPSCLGSAKPTNELMPLMRRVSASVDQPRFAASVAWLFALLAVVRRRAPCLPLAPPASIPRSSCETDAVRPRLFSRERESELRPGKIGSHVVHLLEIQIPRVAQRPQVRDAVMHGRKADEHRRLLLRERQPPPFIVRRIAADSQLDRRNAEIPSAEFCHRQIKADACVDDAVVVSKRRADVALDDKDCVRFRINAACGRLALLSKRGFRGALPRYSRERCQLTQLGIPLELLYERA